MRWRIGNSFPVATSSSSYLICSCSSMYNLSTHEEDYLLSTANVGRCIQLGGSGRLPCSFAAFGVRGRSTFNFCAVSDVANDVAFILWRDSLDIGLWYNLCIPRSQRRRKNWRQINCHQVWAQSNESAVPFLCLGNIFIQHRWLDQWPIACLFWPSKWRTAPFSSLASKLGQLFIPSELLEDVFAVFVFWIGFLLYYFDRLIPSRSEKGSCRAWILIINIILLVALPSQDILNLQWMWAPYERW